MRKIKDLRTKDKIMMTEYNKRIGVLGGTFDPIHIGHKALGEAAIKEAKLSKLIVMPAKIQPFKKYKNVTEAFHRKAMVELAFGDSQNVIISDYELNNTIISYTYDTLTFLKGAYPDFTLYFVLGTDSFLDIEEWYKGTQLLSNFNFIVSTRPGYKEKELENTIAEFIKKYQTEVIKIRANMPDVSSTDIREKIAKGNSVSDLIPDKVERYIRENGLYR